MRAAPKLAKFLNYSPAAAAAATCRYWLRAAIPASRAPINYEQDHELTSSGRSRGRSADRTAYGTGRPAGCQPSMATSEPPIWICANAVGKFTDPASVDVTHLANFFAQPISPSASACLFSLFASFGRSTSIGKSQTIAATCLPGCLRGRHWRRSSRALNFIISRRKEVPPLVPPRAAVWNSVESRRQRRRRWRQTSRL